MEEYLVLVVFDDYEARRYVKEATCMFNAIADVREKLSKIVKLDTIVGIQAEKLDYPYFSL